MSDVGNLPEIVDIPKSLSWRFPALDDLVPGKAMFIPWIEMATTQSDPAHLIRALVYSWEKRLGWKLRTKKSARGMYVIRDE